MYTDRKSGRIASHVSFVQITCLCIWLFLSIPFCVCMCAYV